MSQRENTHKGVSISKGYKEHSYTYIHTYIHIYIYIYMYIYNLYQMKGIFTQIKCFQKFFLKDVILRGCDVFMVYFN